MFQNCGSLASLDLSKFSAEKMNNAIGLKDMFLGCNSLKIRNIKIYDFKIRLEAIIDLMGI
jgi:hypothetical protein